jgi:hypothetical protein
MQAACAVSPSILDSMPTEGPEKKKKSLKSSGECQAGKFGLAFSFLWNMSR